MWWIISDLRSFRLFSSVLQMTSTRVESRAALQYPASLSRSFALYSTARSTSSSFLVNKPNTLGSHSLSIAGLRSSISTLSGVRYAPLSPSCKNPYLRMCFIVIWWMWNWIRVGRLLPLGSFCWNSWIYRSCTFTWCARIYYTKRRALMNRYST